MKKPRAYICIDASNSHYYLRKAGWQIDWVKFKSYCEDMYDSPQFFYYEGIPSKAQYFDNYPKHTLDDFIEVKDKKLKYFEFLKRCSFKVRYKPVGRVYDDTSGQYKHKCNFDVELTVDALDGIDLYDVFVLFSGDGDFVKLIKYLKGKRKKTVVIAPSERLSDNLEKAANQVIYLEDLEKEIKRTD
jgi:uncharacterized LabA/DUF88 family protein